MFEVSVKLLNGEELRSAFDLAPELMKPALKGAVNKSLLTIGKQADINLKKEIYDAPLSKSGYKRTGNLLASVLDPNRGLTLATGDRFYQGSVGSGTNYGLFVEMGTRFMAAKPFLRPAVESSQDQIQGFFTEAVQSVLNRIGRATL